MFLEQLISRPLVVKSYYWVHWELLLAGRGKRDHQNFRQKISSKNCTSTNYVLNFLEQFISRPPAVKSHYWVHWELMLAGRGKSDHDNFCQNFSPKIIHLKTISLMFLEQLISRPPAVKSYYWVHWELLLARRGKRDHRNFRYNFFPNIIHLQLFFLIFLETYFSACGCEELLLCPLGVAVGRKREERS